MDTNVKIKSINLQCREWFRRSAGNSYQSFKLYINDSLVAVSSDFSGYGNFYQQVAVEILIALGITKKTEKFNPTLWSACRDNGIKLTYNKIHGLKRELFKPENINFVTLSGVDIQINQERIK